MRTPAAVAILIALHATPVRAQATRVEPLSAAPPALQQAIARNESIAARMYSQDYAAAIAHDELATHIASGRDEYPRGWITDDHDGGVTVLFVAERGRDYVAIYKVVTEDGRIAPDGYAKLDPPLPLSESQQAQFRARRLASGADVARCSSAYNTIVLPAYDRDDGSMHVYLIAATSVPGRMIFGGHYRFTISKDGNSIQDHRAFTKTCLEMKSRPGGAAWISHLLDANPTELHVYLNLLHRRPIAVATMENKLIWYIEGGRVTGFNDLTEKPGEPRGSNHGAARPGS